MNTAVTDYLYQLKRAESDLAFDGRTRLLTRQTMEGQECVLIHCEKKSITNAMDTILLQLSDRQQGRNHQLRH